MSLPIHERRLADFIVGGAQKAGTASFCGLLAQHPRIFFSTPREPMFFCRDDPRIHPHTFMNNPALWQSFDWQRRREALLDDYSRLFRGATRDQLVGEGSTTYLPATSVARRLHDTMPLVRLVFLLRNPIDRAYSAYYHHLKNFRVVRTFEDQLRFEPCDLLDAGRYREHLSRYFSLFPRGQVRVFLFEDFIRRPLGVFQETCAFLGLEALDIDLARSHSNEALVPLFSGVQRGFDAALRALGSNFEASALRLLQVQDRRPLVVRALDKMLRGLGKLNRSKRRYPPMKAQTRASLTEYFARENAGLSALIDQDVTRFWKDFTDL